MTEQEYLEIPWSMEDTIENMKLLKDIIQKMVIKENLHGKGEQDAKEVAFDFDRAIKALEKQIPKKPDIEGDGYCPEGNLVYDTWICPNCGTHYEIDYDNYDYCPKCGQAIDKSFMNWSEEE